jgi:hypothetical protein
MICKMDNDRADGLTDSFKQKIQQNMKLNDKEI